MVPSLANENEPRNTTEQLLKASDPVGSFTGTILLIWTNEVTSDARCTYAELGLIQECNGSGKSQFTDAGDEYDMSCDNTNE